MHIGIDLGGTKIEIAAFSDDEVTLVRRRVSTPASDYEAIVEAVGTLVDGVERELGTSGTVGIGTPGSTSPATGNIRNANSTVMIGKPFRRDLERRLGREIRIANDADCLALSEAVDGAAAGAPSVFGVIIGSGVGGGIVANGRLLPGRNGIAGEWGHNSMPWMTPDEFPGPPCYCGKHGCIETFLSGPSLARDHAAHGGGTTTAGEIALAAAAGDESARASIERYANRLARALASVINVLDPHVVVLGGGVSNVAALYERLPELLPAYVFSDVVETRVVQALHGDSSGVRGAARLWSGG